MKKILAFVLSVTALYDINASDIRMSRDRRDDRNISKLVALDNRSETELKKMIRDKKDEKRIPRKNVAKHSEHGKKGSRPLEIEKLTTEQKKLSRSPVIKHKTHKDITPLEKVMGVDRYGKPLKDSSLTLDGIIKYLSTGAYRKLAGMDIKHAQSYVRYLGIFNGKGILTMLFPKNEKLSAKELIQTLYLMKDNAASYKQFVHLLHDSNIQRLSGGKISDWENNIVKKTSKFKIVKNKVKRKGDEDVYSFAVDRNTKFRRAFMNNLVISMGYAAQVAYDLRKAGKLTSDEESKTLQLFQDLCRKYICQDKSTGSTKRRRVVNRRSAKKKIKPSELKKVKKLTKLSRKDKSEIKAMFGISDGQDLFDFDQTKDQFLNPKFLSRILECDEHTVLEYVADCMPHLGLLQTESDKARFIPFQGKTPKDICELMLSAKGAHYIMDPCANGDITEAKLGKLPQDGKGYLLSKKEHFHFTSFRELIIGMAKVFILAEENNLSRNKKDILMDRLLEIVSKFKLHN